MATLIVKFIKDIKSEHTNYVDAKCVKVVSLIGRRMADVEKKQGYEYAYYNKRSRVWVAKYNDRWHIYNAVSDLFPKIWEYDRLVVTIS